MVVDGALSLLDKGLCEVEQVVALGEKGGCPSSAPS